MTRNEALDIAAACEECDDVATAILAAYERGRVEEARNVADIVQRAGHLNLATSIRARGGK